MSDSVEFDLRVDFETFFRREYPTLVGVATALTSDVDDAEDLVQDTMVQVLLRWKRVQSLQRPGGWAHRVLVNRCIGWMRRRRTHAGYLARLRRQEPVTAGPSIESLAFWSAVRQLPSRHQQVMALHYAGDLSVEEVAEILQVPAGTIRSDLTRARAAIARLLAD
jgi:RNA polymerase sigma-70 factor, ECF subfamily